MEPADWLLLPGQAAADREEGEELEALSTSKCSEGAETGGTLNK